MKLVVKNMLFIINQDYKGYIKFILTCILLKILNLVTCSILSVIIISISIIFIEIFLKTLYFIVCKRNV